MRYARLATRSFATALALSMSGATVTAQAADKIRILSPTWSGYAPVFVASDLGYFKALGLERRAQVR